MAKAIPRLRRPSFVVVCDTIVDTFVVRDDIEQTRRVAMARALVKVADYVICTRAEYWRKMATDKGGHFGKLGVAK
eukprot:3934898-Heterocapsa_arctica.AAC.1